MHLEYEVQKGEFTVLEEVEESYNYKMIDFISNKNKSGVLLIFGMALLLQKKICNQNLGALMKVSLEREVFRFLEEKLELSELYLFVYGLFSENQAYFKEELLEVFRDEDNFLKQLVLNEIREEFDVNFRMLLQSDPGLKILRYQLNPE